MTPDATPKRTTDEHEISAEKRKSPRRGRHVPVRCVGLGGRWYAGRTVDLSRGGMLVEITDPDFVPLGESLELLPLAARVATQFPQGMDAEFGDGAVQAHANVVRLVSKVGGRPLLLLGCQFDPPLSEIDGGLLGLNLDAEDVVAPAEPFPPPPLPPDVSRRARPAAPAARAAVDVRGDGADARRFAKPLLRGLDELCALIGAEEARWRAAEGPATQAAVVDLPAEAPSSRAPASQPGVAAWAVATDVVVHLFPAGAPLHGARCSGRLAALRGRTAVVDLPAPAHEDDPAAWAAGLGASARVVCLRDGRVLWDTRARVAHVGAGHEVGWARATLHAMRPPPLHARRALGASTDPLA